MRILRGQPRRASKTPKQWRIWAGGLNQTIDLEIEWSMGSAIVDVVEMTWDEAQELRDRLDDIL
jgi:hypothetical protein